MKKKEEDKNEIKGRDSLIQAIMVFESKAGLIKLEKIKKLTDDLITEGSDNIKDVKKYFQYLPEIKEIIDFVIKNKDSLVNTSDKNERLKELTDLSQRLQAEFENYKKRTEKECNDFKKYASAKLITKLLPILDSFELAIKNTKEQGVKKGVELIYSQLYQALEEEGLRKIDAINQKFDPYKHEVLLTEESKDKEDIVIEELQKGYMLNDEVLRHTKVKITKKPKGEKK